MSQKSKYDRLLRWRTKNGSVILVDAGEYRIMREPSKGLLNKYSGHKLLSAFIPESVTAGDFLILLEQIVISYLPTFKSQAPETISVYISSLLSNFVIVSQIEQILAKAIFNAQVIGDRRLESFLEKVLIEESNHADLIIKDLADLGVHRPREAIGGYEFDAAKSLLNCLESYVGGESLYGVVGVGFVLETNALSVDQQFFRGLEQLLGARSGAIRYFSEHSAIGAETEHFLDLCDFIAGTDPVNMPAIASGCEAASILVSKAAGAHYTKV